MKTKKPQHLYGESVGKVNLQSCTLTLKLFHETLKHNQRFQNAKVRTLDILLTDGRKLVLTPLTSQPLAKLKSEIVITGLGKIRGQANHIIGQLRFKDQGIVSGEFFISHKNEHLNKLQNSTCFLADIKPSQFTLSELKAAIPCRKPGAVGKTNFLTLKTSQGKTKVEILDAGLDLAQKNTYVFVAWLNSSNLKVIGVLQFKDDEIINGKLYSLK